MDSLPCSDPGNPTMINVSIANLEHVKVAAKLQPTYPEVFKSDLGLYRPSKATLRLKPEAKLVFRQKRPVPYAALPAVEKELERLESSCAISKVNYPNRAAPIVIAKKSNGQ
ncbi:unnamed protein product [Heligmosomoides polygyrus]|uniref:Reverse transcriptase domain-containing protein n=1 Tax=Heligmosomoides polygyrus TaxID=6339 RepID=A0A183F9X9_HELPZ|nr:unnamed protein product [Heligmosomoides polygyrus]